MCFGLMNVGVEEYTTCLSMCDIIWYTDDHNTLLHKH